MILPEGWVNYLCDPNVRLVNFVIFQKELSRKEITADYRKMSKVGFQMKCNRGSKNLREASLFVTMEKILKRGLLILENIQDSFYLSKFGLKVVNC
jgi:hypothetical protein